MEKPATESDLADRLGANLSAFVGFARQRLNDPELAVDVVQESLLKALRSAGQLRDSDRLLPRFYRTLRSGIVDAYRWRGVAQATLEKFQSELERDQPEAERTLCACLEGLLPTLKPDYAAMLRRVDLQGESVVEVGRGRGSRRTTPPCAGTGPGPNCGNASNRPAVCARNTAVSMALVNECFRGPWRIKGEQNGRRQESPADAI